MPALFPLLPGFEGYRTIRNILDGEISVAALYEHLGNACTASEVSINLERRKGLDGLRVI